MQPPSGSPKQTGSLEKRNRGGKGMKGPAGYSGNIIGKVSLPPTHKPKNSGLLHPDALGDVESTQTRLGRTCGCLSKGIG